MKRLKIGVLFSRVISKPLYLIILGELNCERKCCSRCKQLERESSADLTAKSSPEVVVAIETVAEAPRPIEGPLVHSIEERERERERSEGKG